MNIEKKNELAIYLYCFTLPTSSSLAILGVDDEHIISNYSCGGINAVISLVALADFTGETGEINLQNIAWLSSRACRHALIINKMLEQGSVYPLSFGTLFSNISALEQQMYQRAQDVLHVLHRIGGCQEWSLEATLDRRQAVDALMAEGLESGQICLPEAAGRRHLEEQKKRRNFSANLNNWLIERLDDLQNELRPLSLDFCPRRITDDKVLHWAYLLPIEKVTDFEQKVMAITSHYEVFGFKFRVTGPWAAYSFCRPVES